MVYIPACKRLNELFCSIEKLKTNFFQKDLGHWHISDNFEDRNAHFYADSSLTCPSSADQWFYHNGSRWTKDENYTLSVACVQKRCCSKV